MLMKASPALVIFFILFQVPLLPLFAQEAAQQTKNNQMLASYPDTVDGLHSFLHSYIETVKEADFEQRARLDANMRIPSPEKWFTTIYGPEDGHRMASAYIRNPPRIFGFIDSCRLDVWTQIHVARVEFPNENSELLSGIPMFLPMKHVVPYYTAFLSNGGENELCVVYPVFVYVKQAFRTMYRQFGQGIDDPDHPRCGLQRLLFKRGNVSGVIMNQKLLAPHPALLPLPSGIPQYSPRSVTLLLSVSCEGNVLETDYLDGPPQLFKPASDKVKKWKYQKTFLNGTPIEVLTTATVNFGPSN
jgi:hypothetical protein